MDLSWWNLIPTYFDGTAIELGNFPVRWYGIMYIFAFVTAYLTLWHINKKDKLGYTKDQFDSLFTWIIAGIILGARLGYVIFYKPGYYLANPTEILLPMTHDALGYHFSGIAGMSYHGGLILGIVFTIIGLKRNKMDVWQGLNLCFLAAPLAYTWGRWGNFINGELYGEVTTSAIGMYFPLAHDSSLANPILHHPSQLYEMCFEGVILFVLLYNLRRIPLLKDKMPCLYLMGYGLFRFFIEFFRKSDAHLGRNDLFGMSRGQTLCSVMVLSGLIWLIVMIYRQKKQAKV
ncbi:Prolipoprotein diacylglyceryl transferase [Fibrobacter sp. UWH9]|uniref:prolipoprotein diacylglyceryl transferase n=1 Tax=unclassified Fibrobacter TaxID=2634177 RepID=UPI0009169603|nr:MULTISPECIES: prolipoprotein diacylglyceryl transferase [unclassified Fibrobacter]OWV15066.1 prolipoprotein diacylglyceryl transferase [Fibrobacter sp. UWH1]SHH34388.1 Prolipoprotein diacylglyceryl transferase [Fibrobacter sp. UWH9]SHL41274.1 Prolipoprotein diacylglyceryl transferase [Fibrobacter sp. UWH5]SHL51130.1 Prolipoprotein diacylglyceryl transferase [Fibrobacter sp. UWH6]